MRIFIAGTNSYKGLVEKYKPPYILESFYYIRDWQIPLIKTSKMFLLDSGAYSFMQMNKKGKNKNLNFEEYLDRYIGFINKHDVKYFFELDIDHIVGYPKVLEYRKKLEKETRKKCIPVWHKSRGKEEYVHLCKNYDYIAIGGITGQKEKNNFQKYIRWFKQIADEHNTKVHLLGATDKITLSSGFFSADSTAWQTVRYGGVAVFKEGVVKIIRKENSRLADSKAVMEHNIQEWIKCQKFWEVK